jgi:hypothetical protein
VAIVVLQFSLLQLAVLLFEVKELGVVAIVVLQFSQLQLAVLPFEVKYQTWYNGKELRHDAGNIVNR